MTTDPLVSCIVPSYNYAPSSAARSTARSPRIPGRAARDRRDRRRLDRRHRRRGGRLRRARALHAQGERRPQQRRRPRHRRGLRRPDRHPRRRRHLARRQGPAAGGASEGAARGRPRARRHGGDRRGRRARSPLVLRDVRRSPRSEAASCRRWCAATSSRAAPRCSALHCATTTTRSARHPRSRTGGSRWASPAWRRSSGCPSPRTATGGTARTWASAWTTRRASLECSASATSRSGAGCCADLHRAEVGPADLIDAWGILAGSVARSAEALGEPLEAIAPVAPERARARRRGHRDRHGRAARGRPHRRGERARGGARPQPLRRPRAAPRSSRGAARARRRSAHPVRGRALDA